MVAMWYIHGSKWLDWYHQSSSGQATIQGNGSTNKHRGLPLPRAAVIVQLGRGYMVYMVL